ncbi:MAG TPA: DUF445 domain-containing protein [Candidatus Deferrimicrobiaceae bacterium]|nr:DUF445 domain-containing protein [Candidatus Deferrimicrobiaceae bacterium]
MTGFTVLTLSLHQEWVRGPFWVIAASAFEAGTIGGVADWFAVTALFREVRIPLIRRHTNIIVKNRARIVDGIADMVQNRWLSPAVIEEHLGRFSASRALLEYLGDGSRREKLLVVLRDLLGKIVEGLDGPEIAGFLSRTLQDQVKGIDLAGPLGVWMEQAIARRDHDAVWDLLLKSLTRSLGDPEIEGLFRRLSRQALDAYKEGGLHRKVVLNIAEAVDLLDDRTVARALLDNLSVFVQEARGNPGHPIRQNLDAMLLDFARALSSGDPEAVSTVNTLRARLVENTDAVEVIRKVLGQFRATALAQLDHPDSDLASLMRRFLNERLSEFARDADAQEKLDAWVRETAVELVRKRHAYIGDMVRGSLEKLRDIDLAAQIESKVGSDLQYIRLNGAIVGALVGAVLAIFRIYLF